MAIDTRVLQEKVERLEGTIDLLQAETIAASEGRQVQDEQFVVSSEWPDETPEFEYTQNTDHKVATDCVAIPGYLGNDNATGTVRVGEAGLEKQDGGNWIILNHANTSDQADVQPADTRVYIQGVDLDSFGHVVGLDTAVIDTGLLKGILDTSNGFRLPEGGLQYQQLTKYSDNDFAYKWDWTRSHA